MFLKVLLVKGSAKKYPQRLRTKGCGTKNSWWYTTYKTSSERMLQCCMLHRQAFVVKTLSLDFKNAFDDVEIISP